MKSELDARTIASLRAELQDFLESACAAGSDKGSLAEKKGADDDA